MRCNKLNPDEKLICDHRNNFYFWSKMEKIYSIKFYSPYDTLSRNKVKNNGNNMCVSLGWVTLNDRFCLEPWSSRCYPIINLMYIVQYTRQMHQRVHLPTKGLENPGSSLRLRSGDSLKALPVRVTYKYPLWTVPYWGRGVGNSNLFENHI